MHELSIALSILDLVALEVEVGRRAGVDISALAFSMKAAQRYSPFEKAQVNIVEVEPLSRCKICGQEFAPSRQFGVCPHCHSIETELLHGRELRLKSILVE